MLVTPSRKHDGALPEGCDVLLGRDAPSLVRAYPSLTGSTAATPLRRLAHLARRLGIGALHAKDEGFRLGLESFKALGGSFAVARLVQDWAAAALARDVAPSELTSPEVRRIAAEHTVACATDGNHGRSVAAGARLLGCRAVIFVHPHVNAERLDAMRAFGATIEVVDGTYDDAVAACARVAAARGWDIVSDTAWPGYETVPGHVMQGYTVMIDEALAALEEQGERLTHVFVQGGVGGLAAAVAGHIQLRYGADRPRIVVVEPERANCLLQSAQAGKPVQIQAGAPTVMGMLECYQPSLLAWRVLERAADAFMDVPDEAAIATMRTLATPDGDDPAIVAGESGGAGLAGLIRAAGDPRMRADLGLDERASVLVIISEGATAPKRYAELVGRTPDAVRAST